ncbi:SHOCT domain-containing protein [Actinacidiphila glaucinigra]|uniref:SHOCT domain-containing protein n=1 Tax=Actinacidiphila glaucinigra TaxID=235986 RepID=UPI0033A65319
MPRPRWRGGAATTGRSVASSGASGTPRACPTVERSGPGRRLFVRRRPVRAWATRPGRRDARPSRWPHRPKRRRVDSTDSGTAPEAPGLHRVQGGGDDVRLRPHERLGLGPDVPRPAGAARPRRPGRDPTAAARPDGGAGRAADRDHPGARALLAERYARGEIDDEEYRRRLAVLEEATAHRHESR